MNKKQTRYHILDKLIDLNVKYEKLSKQMRALTNKAKESASKISKDKNATRQGKATKPGTTRNATRK
jgi:uncharacterized coiled-coil protein SlyX